MIHRQMDSMLLQMDSTPTRQDMPSNGLSPLHLWVSEVVKIHLHKGALCRLFLNSFITQCAMPIDKPSVLEVSYNYWFNALQHTECCYRLNGSDLAGNGLHSILCARKLSNSQVSADCHTHCTPRSLIARMDLQLSW